MKVIGFSNRYYTLWEVTEENKDLGNGSHLKITHYYYLKNISFIKKKAMEKYPDAIVNENLRGTTKYFKTEKLIFDTVDTFRFGKYKFNKIAESEDISYIAWYWDNIFDDAHKNFVTEFLKSKGYEVRKYSTGVEYLMSPEELIEEAKELAVKNSMIKKFQNHEEFSLDIQYNPDFEGEMTIDDIIYQFEEVKENCYQGCYYYLPVLNGKAKRIKNKTITITDYDVFNLDDNNVTIIVRIKDFIINK